MNREKVILALKIHADGCGYRSHHCDAMECPYRYGDESCDIEEMCRDAFELLKEQEAKPVEVCGQMFTVEYGHCPTCGKGMDSDTYPRWCGFCGQAVKWG